MDESSSDPWIVAIFFVGALASGSTLLLLAVRSSSQPLLRLEQRLPVPWGVVGCLGALLMVAAGIWPLVMGPGKGWSDKEPENVVMEMVGGGVASLIVFGMFFTLVVLISGAGRFDIGLPDSWRQFTSDAAIGAVAFLAAVLPVYVVQMVMFSVIGEPSQHPLVEMVLTNPSPPLLVTACLLAVVVAPLTEEILFRLLLQGWLEKWEDRRLGWRTAATGTMEELEPVSGVIEELAIGVSTETTEPLSEPEPPQAGLAGLPYGWLPILISSILFAAAHIGHGADPIPLFPLAIALGYVYQRTHRIVPCIVAHALFNLLAMTLLLRTIL